jgi:hypothetical protein
MCANRKRVKTGKILAAELITMCFEVYSQEYDLNGNWKSNKTYVFLPVCYRKGITKLFDF